MINLVFIACKGNNFPCFPQLFFFVPLKKRAGAAVWVKSSEKQETARIIHQGSLPIERCQIVLDNHISRLIGMSVF